MKDSGPWSEEPDYAEWKDPETGFLCVAARHVLGFWTASVGVPSSHPFFKVPGEQIDLRVESWGGITRSSSSKPRISHTFYKRNFLELLLEDLFFTEELWWLGMDFGHSFDYIPVYEPKAISSLRDVLQNPESSKRCRQGRMSDYRSLDFVMDECSHLSSQLYSSGPELL